MKDKIATVRLNKSEQIMLSLVTNMSEKIKGRPLNTSDVIKDALNLQFETLKKQSPEVWESVKKEWIVIGGKENDKK